MAYSLDNIRSNHILSRVVQGNSMFKTVAVGAILAIGDCCALKADILDRWINQIPCRQLHLAVLIWLLSLKISLRGLSVVHSTTLPLIFARSRVLSMQKLGAGSLGLYTNLGRERVLP
ncbi:hypothetical protein NC653_023732 [Populus alba x Populus x berolinensis]|uniref:Uncharacterized protein n=1 Tax=Populus alba x Populus x berolinensis TaxID=444605 RepID=A0AAD6MIL7_9ROSI|nr:hypothetical protein NC653_023732 [Populus alba x Populus x berolinensis]